MAVARTLTGELLQRPSNQQIRSKIKQSRIMHGFKMKPGYLYTVVRAISARINQNYDSWPSDELKKSYQTFIGKPVFVNHTNEDPKTARGVVVAARYVENGNDKYVEVIQEIDAQRFPKLAHEIKTGGLDSVSMGAEAGFTICSFCANKAIDESDMCDHVKYHKGEKLRKFNRRTGKTEDIMVYESCHKLNFFELSYVFDPADETAVASKVLVANKTAGAKCWGEDCEETSAGSPVGQDFPAPPPSSAPIGSDSGGSSSGGSARLPGLPEGAGSSDVSNLGLNPAAADFASRIKDMYPDLDIGGRRDDPYPDHPSGNAADYMVGDDTAKGNRIKDLALANDGVDYVIWQQQMWYPDGRRERMEDRGSPTQNHMDHPHVMFASAEKIFERKVLKVAGIAGVSERSPKMSFEQRVLATAGFKTAYGEPVAPPSVDTLREEGSMPEDDTDDFHHYVKPPKELLMPDLSRAGIDREPDAGGDQFGPPPQQPGQQMMTIQIPIPPTAPQIPMQSFAPEPSPVAIQPQTPVPPQVPPQASGPPQQMAAMRRYFESYFNRRIAAGEGEDEEETPPAVAPTGPPPGVGVVPNAPTTPGQPQLGQVPGVAPPTGPGAAPLENWQLPGGTNPTDPNGLAMPYAQSQVGFYSPTLERTVTTEDVSNQANQDRIKAWDAANPTNVFDKDMKYDPTTMERGVQHIFTKPGEPGATPPAAPAGEPHQGTGAEPGPVPAPEPPPAAPQTADALPNPADTATQMPQASLRKAVLNLFYGSTLENAPAGSTTDRTSKGNDMGRSTLAQRGKVASRGRQQHFAGGPLVDGGDRSRNDQGEHDGDEFLTPTPPAKSEKLPNEDKHNISNTEGNLVARVQAGREQLIKDAQALQQFYALKRYAQDGTAAPVAPATAPPASTQPGAVGNTPATPPASSPALVGASRRTAGGEAGGPKATTVDPPLSGGPDELKGKHFQSADPNDGGGLPHDASLKLFQAFDQWLTKATGHPCRNHTEANIKRGVEEFTKRANIHPQSLFPALGIVLREARKNEAAAKKKGSSVKKKAVELDYAAPDERMDVTAPVRGVTDADAQASQFSESDFDHNMGKGIAKPDRSTGHNWAPGEAPSGKKSSVNKTAGGLLAMRLAEAMIASGLEPNSRERKYQLAAEFQNMNREAILDRVALTERFAAVISDIRTKVASGMTRGAAKSPIPPGLAQGVRTASTQRVAANDPVNDSLLYG